VAYITGGCIDDEDKAFLTQSHSATETHREDDEFELKQISRLRSAIIGYIPDSKPP
jgi:hypothetical protein